MTDGNDCEREARIDADRDALESWERIAFQIIAAVGNARSCYIEAIHMARKGDFTAAHSLMEQGAASFSNGHTAHLSLIQREASGVGCALGLIMAHAEDQLMSAETFGILAEEFIETYRMFGTDGRHGEAYVSGKETHTV